MRRLIRQRDRESNSIMLPNYAPIMPTFQGQVNEEQVLQIDCLRQVAGTGRKDSRSKMSTTVIAEIPGHELPSEERVNYLNVDHSVKSWLLTHDHKRIALLYLISITLMFFVGGFFAVLMRLNLIEPHGAWWRRRPTTSYSPCTA